MTVILEYIALTALLEYKFKYLKSGPVNARPAREKSCFAPVMSNGEEIKSIAFRNLVSLIHNQVARGISKSVT